MGSTGTVLLVIGVVIVVGAVLYFQYQAHKKKVAEFTTFAAQRGWRYIERDRTLKDRFLGTPFGKGHGRDARHILRGEHRGRQLLVFEYSYKETHGSGDSQRTETYHHTVASVYIPEPKPMLEVGREGLGRKLLGFVGMRDLQLESEQFNETFHIRTDNDKFAYDILHPRMMEWMLADQRALDNGFRFERGDLVVWDREKIDLQKAQWMLDYLCDILDQVPSFVWKS
ncbi:DUF3137 domain-containing protein [Actinophytocola sp.]|jgi:hypothetical protein|uniref:DUF3137 domain-containing protein n=1 Tax=Actinophytocola sp. TaxID=1872138 RepID=UPI002ED957BC